MADHRPNATTVDDDLDRLRSASLSEIERVTPDLLPAYLAARFAYDVRKGGFAQLLFNMRGEYLSEIEDMLIAANADVAREHYVRAIKACLAREDDYQQFLDSNYLDDNALKNELHSVSLEYFARDVPFVVEAYDYLARVLSAGPPAAP